MCVHPLHSHTTKEQQKKPTRIWHMSMADHGRVCSFSKDTIPSGNEASRQKGGEIRDEGLQELWSQPCLQPGFHLLHHILSLCFTNLGAVCSAPHCSLDSLRQVIECAGQQDTPLSALPTMKPTPGSGYFLPGPSHPTIYLAPASQEEKRRKTSRQRQLCTAVAGGGCQRGKNSNHEVWKGLWQDPTQPW